jgi:hypothetical protein
MNLQQTVRSLALSLILTCALAGCGQDVDTHSLVESNLISAFSQEEIESANFQFIQQQVFTPHCLKCHASDVMKGDVNLETYASVFELRNQIRAEVEADRMPRRAPPLAPELKSLLFSWIDRGAPEL